MDLIGSVEQLFEDHGDRTHAGATGLLLTARSHALQCAQRAEWADAEPALVIAALLHDVGHFIPAPSDAFTQGDDHELRAVWWLAGKLPPRCIEPIRLHVQAKRYLAARDLEYVARLPEVSRLSLSSQGGPMAAEECTVFESQPFARQALALRRWDDQSHETGMRTPPLAYYLEMMVALLERAEMPQRLPVAAMDG